MKNVLSIDTSRKNFVSVSFRGKDFQKTVAREARAQLLLELIDEVLEKTKKDVRDIEEITVHTGPGSFTGLRVGIAIANAIGFALSIPVNGKQVIASPVVPTYQKKEETS